MSEPLTAAGAALVYELTLDETPVAAASWRRSVEAVEQAAASRAVDEALSVERVQRGLYAHILPRDHGQLCPGWTDRGQGDTFDRCDCWVKPREQQRAAALVAHLRGPR